MTAPSPESSRLDVSIVTGLEQLSSAFWVSTTTVAPF
jgi:hypothetical protein